MTETQDTAFDPELPEIAPTCESAVESELIATETPVVSPHPWGPWATVGWTLLCIAVLLVAQIVGAITFLIARSAISGSLKTDDLGTNGNLLALATLFSTLGTTGLIVFLIYIRGYLIRDYLALYWPSPRAVVTAMIGLAILLVATDATSYLAGKPLVPAFMVDIYRTSWLPALLLALVVLAPLGEETIFRGFLYKGLAASRGGPVLAIVVSAITFTLLHGLQYDIYALTAVAAMGFYLGYIRYQSGSLLLTMLLHAIGNAFATLELIVQEHWFK